MRSIEEIGTSGPEKVAIFVPSLRGGGAERAMLVFASGLVEIGMKVDLIVASYDGALCGMVPPEINLVNFDKAHVSECILELRRYLLRERPAILFSTMCNGNLVAVLSGMLARVDTKIIIRESIAPVSEPKTAWRRRINHALARWFYELADAVIAVSEGVAAELVSMNPRLLRKIFVLPTPVITTDMQLKAQAAPSHPWFGDKRKRIVLAAGRLDPQKGFDVLLKAFSRIAGHRDDVRLIIMGEGDSRPELEQLSRELQIEKLVSMPGYIHNPFPFFRSAHVFVLSSRYEGMPNVLIQALACGLNVVATDCRSGPRECLENGKYGILVQVDNVEHMASAIESALGRRAPSDVAEYFMKKYNACNAAREYLRIGGLKPAPG